MIKGIALGCAVSLLAGCSALSSGQGVTGSVFDTSQFPSVQSGSQSSNQSSTSSTTAAQDTTETTVTRNTSTEIETLSFPNMPDTTPDGTGTLYNGSADVSITASGTYTFSGTFSDTTITVNVDKDADDGVVYLVLDGVSMTSDSGTPIYIIEAKDVVIVLADGSENTIYQGAVTTTEEDFPSGAIYTKADTVITGSGSLSVNTLYNDAINARDDLIIDGASIIIDAVSDGIVAQDLLAIQEADLRITAGKDGLKTTNTEDEDKGDLIITSGTYSIAAEGDGISAERTLQIDGGSFIITSGGGYTGVLNTITVGEGSSQTQATDLLETSMKGLKANDILINGGGIDISSYEDGIKAENTIVMNGGTVYLLIGDDGMTADNALTINDGVITIEYGYEGIEGDYLSIHGGEISVTVLDDGINAGSSAGLIYITGGNIFIASQGDCIDSNGDLTIEGGEIVFDSNAIYTGGDGEIDVSGTTTITGGTLVDTNGNEVSASSSGSGMQSFFSTPSRQSTQTQNNQRR
ncbi:MAG: carbohydrate-binding domain-containing protein [Faecalibacterium sp.]